VAREATAIESWPHGSSRTPQNLVLLSHLAMLPSQMYGTHYGKTRKAQALSEEVKALEAAGVAAQAEYVRVRDRNLEVHLIRKLA